MSLTLLLWKGSDHYLFQSPILLPRCYQDRTIQPLLAPCRGHHPLWFLVGLGCLRLVCLKFVNRRSSVKARFWSRFGIYLNHTQSLSVDENSRCWFADSCSSSLSIALNRNISISPFKARALGSSPRRVSPSGKRQTRQNGFGVGGSLVHVRCTPCERVYTASLPVVDRPLAKAGVRLAKLLNEALGKKYAGGGTANRWIRDCIENLNGSATRETHGNNDHCSSKR